MFEVTQTKAITHENDETETESEEYLMLKYQLDMRLLKSSAYSPRTVALCMSQDLLAAMFTKSKL
ncbi:hypothetical protein FACS189472_09980 [Alphaproteobacteria bacterium]|nr:hypothetical protein FACS189472_09980 [Alphaproteobacteria bacterium]